ncbi:MAG: hypothetical protein IJ055_01620 [Oscillospiraceae bacterium]|nr:hypothetical protein [Oscillospiraceae bacterium]
MLSYCKAHPKKVLLLAVFGIFALVQSLTLILSSDDYWWAYMPTLRAVLVELPPNGRYASNILTFLMCHSRILCAVLYQAVLWLFLWLSSRLMHTGKGTPAPALLVPVLAIFLMPLAIYREVMTWISGFTNYTLSVVQLMAFFLFSLRILEGGTNGRRKALTALAMAALGFAGAMCVEHVTFCSIGSALLLLILTLRRHHRIHPGQVTYLAGAVGGALLLLQNNQYGDIFRKGVDTTNYRSLDNSYADISLKFIKELVPQFAKPFYWVHILIAGAAVVCYLHRSSKEAPSRYLRASLLIVCLYAAYSFFTGTMFDLEELTFSYRIRSLEAAFTFLDLIAVLYLGYSLLPRAVFGRVCLFQGAGVLCTLPFLVVNPVSSRCFFAAYCMWTLTAGCYLQQALTHCTGRMRRAGGYFALAAVCGFALLYLNADLVNAWVNGQRIRYLHEQLAQGAAVLQVVELPYDDFLSDPFDYLTVDPKDDTENNAKYRQFVQTYYGFDEAFLQKRILLTDTMHYDL